MAWKQSKTLWSCVASVAIATAGFVGAPASASAQPVIATASMTWPDGLNHFILTPSDAATLAEAPADAPATVSSTPVPAPTVETPSGTPGMNVPAGAVLSKAPDGRYLAITQDGKIISLDGSPVPSAEVPKAEAPVTPTVDKPQADPLAPLVGGADGRARSEAFAARVAHLTGVSKVSPLNGGLVAIATKRTKSDLQREPIVAGVADDTLMQMTSVQTATPNDPLYSSEWMLNNTGAGSQAGNYPGTPGADTKAPQGWASSTGAGAIVADIDSGVDIYHSDLSARIWSNTHEICGNGIDDDHNGYVDDCSGWDSADNDNDPRPTGSGSFGAHGTHVAGIIGATGDNNTGIVGMAPNATIMPVKIASGENLASSSILAGVMYAVDNGAKIINASWGVPPGTPRSAVAALEQAVQYAQSHGVLFVAAAGNDGTNIDDSPSWPAGFSKYYDNVITVGASTNSDTPASFSNFGATSVDIFAPGWFILSTVPGTGNFAQMSGTSMASPCVAGAAALVVAAHPGWSPAHVKAQLRDSADRVPALTGFTATGRLNVANALTIAPLAATFYNFNNVVADAPFNGTIHLNVGSSSIAIANQQLRGTLLTQDGGAVYSVAGFALTNIVNNAQSQPITNSAGEAVLSASVPWAPGSIQNGLDMNLAVTLPAGEYLLMLQLTNPTKTSTTNSVYVRFRSSPAVPTDGSGGGAGGSGSSGSTGSGQTGGGSSNGTPGGLAPELGSGAPSGGDGGSSSGWTGASNSSGTTGSGNSGGGLVPELSSGYLGGGSGYPTSGFSSPPTTGSVGGTPIDTSGSTPSSPGTPSSPSIPSDPGVGSGGGTTSPGSTSGSSGTTGGTSTGGGSTPTSGPTTTVPTTPDPDPVHSNGWGIDLVRPRSGSTAGGDSVIIAGSFPQPEQAYVFIGGVRADIVNATTQSLYVTAPAHAAGVVDVRVRSASADITMAQVYTYVAPAQGASGSAPDSSNGSTSNGSGSSGSTTSTTPPSTIAPDVGGPGSVISAPPPLEVRRGALRLVFMNNTTPAGNPMSSLWATATCALSPCPGVLN